MKLCIWNVLIGLTCLLPTVALAADEPKMPGTVKELFADFDPRKEVLDAKIVREWEKDGIVYRYVTSFRAYYDKEEKLFGSKSWAGGLPVFRKLCWQ